MYMYIIFQRCATQHVKMEEHVLIRIPAIAKASRQVHTVEAVSEITFNVKKKVSRVKSLKTSQQKSLRGRPNANFKS